MGNTKPMRFCFEGSRDPENRSGKDCICGGHSANDVSKNKHHNATRARLNHQANAVFKQIWDGSVDMPPEFAEVVSRNFWTLV